MTLTNLIKTVVNTLKRLILVNNTCKVATEKSIIVVESK